MLAIIKSANLKNLSAHYKAYDLIFKKPSGTSRGILTAKKSYFIFIQHKEVTAIGECGLLPGLSCDDVPQYETVLQQLCSDINNYEYWLNEGLLKFPSIRFGLEMALLNLMGGGKHVLFPSAFTQGTASMVINGLIWMGSKTDMLQQISHKLNEGFKCLKLKIGAIHFDDELALLQYIREKFTPEQLEIRVDANGAFAINEAAEKLEKLSAYNLHSIEQPIKAGNWEAMAALCAHTPLPIALDEELIGIHAKKEKVKLLTTIKPKYIILKPSLLGGIEACNEWITAAETLNIGWWITSALESNIGLSAIAQWAYNLKVTMPQGLGTGQLYTNNFESPLYLNGDQLFYNADNKWQMDSLIKTAEQ
jgi:o-succinylbenzoate synthase